MDDATFPKVICPNPACGKPLEHVRIYYRPEICVMTELGETDEMLRDDWDASDVMWDDAPCTGIECPECSEEFPKGHLLYSYVQREGHEIHLSWKEWTPDS